MQAARFLGNGKIAIGEEPLPALRSDEVLIHVEYCGLCGSDRKVFDGGFPLIPGHEVSGTVVDANGNDVKVGSRIAAYLSVYCGECSFCQRGMTNNCLNRAGLLGWSEPWDGGYAEYMAVPTRDILYLDPKVSFEEGVLLLDTLGTGWHALRLADVNEDSTVVVIGCGPLGLGVVAGAIAFGAKAVYASDLVDYRMEAAEDLGATALPPDKLSELEGIDVIVEAAGSQKALMNAIRRITPQGRVVMLGENWHAWNFEPDADTMLKDYSLIRSWYFPVTEFAENQQYFIDDAVDSSKLISHTFPLSELQEAFDLFFSGKTRKVLAKP